MRSVTSRFTTALLLLVILPLAGGGCVAAKPPKSVISVPGSNVRLHVLEDAYYLIKNHYVDPISADKLSASAIRGMEEYAALRKASLNKPGIGSPENTISEEEALKKIGATFGLLLRRPNLDPQLLEQAAIKGMIKVLDPHSAFISAEMYKEMQVETKGQLGEIGLQIGSRENRLAVIAPIEGSPADRAGIKPGDFITKVNDESIENLTPMEVIQKMRGPRGAKMSITLERKGETEPLVFELIREYITIESVHAKVVDDKIAYIKIKQCQDRTSEEVKKTLTEFQSQSIKAIVLDIRNNPGGLLTRCVEVAELFLAPGSLVVSLIGRDGRKDDYWSRSKPFFADIPIVMLVNRGSAAGSEILVGALQEYGRATVVGTPTFGNGMIQTIFPLSEGAGLRLTTAKAFTPKGRAIESNPIEPDTIIQDGDSDTAALSSALAELGSKL